MGKVVLVLMALCTVVTVVVIAIALTSLGPGDTGRTSEPPGRTVTYHGPEAGSDG